MLPILQVGPLAIQLPGLLLLGGLWLGLLLAERSSSKFGVLPGSLYNLVFVALIAGLLGARAVYVLSHWQAFAGNPTSIISLNPGLLDAWGGLLCGILAGLIYGQRKQMQFWPTLDALTPMLAVLGIAAALARLAAGTGFGAVTNLPWGIELWGAKRHPTQVYETIAAVLILGLLWPGRGLIRHAEPGIYFLSFLAASAGARLFLEAFRGDSPLILASLRSAQVAAWVILAGCLLAIYLLNRRKLEAAHD